MPKLHLNDVAICACDTANVSLTARALNHSAAGAVFGDAILFSDDSMSGAFRHIHVARFASRADYSAFIIKSLHHFVQLPFVLVIQWDGYVIDSGAWIAEFRDYDYIGAKWPWYKDGKTVGNGGFSLRSQKLLQTLALPRFEMPHDIIEDVYICRTQRSVLESEYGIRFAPEGIADRFSYERSLPDAPTFGFHGLFNMWRHVDDAGLVSIANQVGGYFIKSSEYAQLIIELFRLRKFIPLRAFYARLRTKLTAAEIYSHLIVFYPNEQLISKCVHVCEALLSPPGPATPQPPSRQSL